MFKGGRLDWTFGPSGALVGLEVLLQTEVEEGREGETRVTTTVNLTEPCSRTHRVRKGKVRDWR